MAARAKNRKTFKRDLLGSQCPDFKVISQKCSSYGPLPKLLKSSAWQKKKAARAKNRKKNPLNISSLASALISKWFHRNVPLIPLYQNCQNGSLLNKMVTRVKNRKTFKWHLRGQWQDFKIISHQCSFYAHLPKLLKWFCSAKQKGCQS